MKYYRLYNENDRLQSSLVAFLGQEFKKIIDKQNTKIIKLENENKIIKRRK